VPEYCLDTYIASGSPAALAQAAGRARTAAERFAPGPSVRDLSSTYLPEDQPSRRVHDARRAPTERGVS